MSLQLMDFELLDEVKDIQVIKTDTKEPLKIYSQMVSGITQQRRPTGTVSKKGCVS